MKTVIAITLVALAAGCGSAPAAGRRPPEAVRQVARTHRARRHAAGFGERRPRVRAGGLVGRCPGLLCAGTGACRPPRPRPPVVAVDLRGVDRASRDGLRRAGDAKDRARLAGLARARQLSGGGRRPQRTLAGVTGWSCRSRRGRAGPRSRHGRRTATGRQPPSRPRTASSPPLKKRTSGCSTQSSLPAMVGVFVALEQRTVGARTPSTRRNIESVQTDRRAAYPSGHNPGGRALGARSGHDHGHQRLLGVEPVLGLVPGGRTGAVQHLVRDLLAVMSRQAVQHDVGGRRGRSSSRSTW